jgi:hypothetical protein
MSEQIKDEPARIRDYPIIGASLPSPTTRDDLAISHWRIKILSCLQRHRHLWTIQSEYPYLAVDGDKLGEMLATHERTTLLSHDFILQNLSREEIGRIVATRMVDGGVATGLTQTSHLFPEGPANPNAYCLVAFNDVLQLGTTPFIADGVWLIVIDSTLLYQYTIAKLESDGVHSYAHSSCLPMDPYRELAKVYRDRFFQNRGTIDSAEQESLSSFLDSVFDVNRNVHDEAIRYHLQHKSVGPEYTHDAPTLTMFGRLAHDQLGAPTIEHNLALLHYRKAIEEFNRAKDAEQSGALEDVVTCGSYCAIALAAFVDAIANRTYFVSQGRHVDQTDSRTPSERLRDEAEKITKSRSDPTKRHFRRLKQSSDCCKALDEIRQIRNSLVHAIETPYTVDADSQLSSLFATVSVANNRRLLRLVREAVAFVVDQIPEVGVPVRLDRRVTWLGTWEVP